MLPAALALIAALSIGVRAAYPRFVERRAKLRRPLGPDGIVRGAGALELRRDGAPAVLLLHGGGDTPQVLAALARHLYDAGFSVRVPLLSGHGRAVAEFRTVSATGWRRDVADEFAALRASHDSVAVVGLSMGGALALTFAAEHDDVRALVLLAPYVAMPRLVRGAAITSTIWGGLYPYFSSGGARSIHDVDAAARGLGHGIFTPAALRALYDLTVAAMRSLSKVRAPTLVIQSVEDNRLSRENTEAAFALLGAAEKELVWTKGAGHVITVDFGHEHVFELTADWLRKHDRPS
jgi:carboxylesterase